MSREKQNNELVQMYRDLGEIFDEEYEKRRLITPQNTAEKMTAKGYRKQSEGEWIFKGLDEFRKYKVTCPFCEAEYIGNYDAYDEPEDFNFCPNCGAKMKGGAE